MKRQGRGWLEYDPQHVLIIDPEVTDSWCDLQDSHNVSDKISFWGPSTKFTTAARIYQDDFKHKAAVMLSNFEFEEDWLGKFLCSSLFKEANIDLHIFQLAAAKKVSLVS